MKKQSETVYNTWKKQGSITRGADELDMTVARFRYNLKRYMNHHGMSTDDINTHHQRAVIKPKMKRCFTEFRRRLYQHPEKKWALFVKDGLIDFANARKADGELIGVYNSLSNVDEVRDDVYWFVKNEMETSND